MEPGRAGGGDLGRGGLTRYAGLVRQLREAGITPAVTLLHFTLPLWMADRGGVAAPDFPDRFARFAAEAGRRLGPGVDLWITLNEPVVQMYVVYVLGLWPPQQKPPPVALRVFASPLRGHAAAARALRAADPGARVGVASNLMLFEPKSRLLVGDWLAAGFAGASWNWAFPDALRDGYFRFFVRMAPGGPDWVALTPGPGLRSELGGPRRSGTARPRPSSS